MKTFREYLEEINAKPPGAPAGTVAASNKGITGGASPGAPSKPSSDLQGVTNVVPAQSNSPTTKPQGTQAPSDMEEPEAVVNVKSGQNAGQTTLKDFKATVTPGDEEIEFKSPDGKSFKVPQEFFIDEQINDLKKLSGI